MMKNKKLDANSVCEFQNCENKAENIVYIRKFGEVRLLCEDHLNSVEDDHPEYITHCPNCNCVFGVN